jgi:selenocysteine lyase/cysteine desulfurase
MKCQKHLFSLPEDVHYLNCATMSPNLKTVEQAGIEGILRKSTPYQLTQEQFFAEIEPIQRLFCKLINGSDHERVAIIPSVSYGLATVAKNLLTKKGLKRGQEILIVEEEFPNDVYAWEEVCKEKGLILRTVSAPIDLKNRGKIWNKSLLKAITKKTCMVVLPHVHWFDGTRFDLETVGTKTREIGALLIIDGTQSVGALSFDVNKIKPDALICGGYKWMLGGYSLGLAYYGEYFDNGIPIEENWINREGSDNFRNLTQLRERRTKGARYSVGEKSNFILLPMLIRALEQLLVWTPEAIQNYAGKLTDQPLKTLKKAGYWVESSDWRGNHLFGLRAPEGIDLENIRVKLAENKIYISLRGNVIRVAVNVFNDEEDLNALLRVLTNNL